MNLYPRLRLALALVLGLATLSADDMGPDQIETLQAKVSSAVVVVKYNADIRVGQQEQTRKMETLGTIVEASGVVLVSNAHVNPGNMERQGMQISVSTRDFRVLIGEKTYAAKQVYKDAEKDYAFLRITHEEEEGADEDAFKDPVDEDKPSSEEPEAPAPEAPKNNDEGQSGQEPEEEDAGDKIKPSTFLQEDADDAQEPGDAPAEPKVPSEKQAKPSEDVSKPAVTFNFEHVTFAPRPLRMGDKLVAFGRYGEPQKYALFFLSTQVSGVITSPKLQYGMTFVNNRMLGTPAFDASGNAVGMILNGTVTTPTGQVVSSGETMLRPVDDLAKIIKDLPAVSEVKDAPADGDKEPEVQAEEEDAEAEDEEAEEPAPEPAK